MASSDASDPGAADEVLVEAALSGRAEAFAPLVGRYRAYVAALVSKGGARPDEVDDLVQESFLEAWRRIRDLRDPARFRGWLAEVALSRGRLRVRRRAVEGAAQQRLERRALERQQHALAAAVASTESGEREAVRAALDGLPDEARTLLALRYVEGRGPAEIARDTGVSAEAVRQRLARALVRLRARFFGASVGGADADGRRRA